MSRDPRDIHPRPVLLPRSAWSRFAPVRSRPAGLSDRPVEYLPKCGHGYHSSGLFSGPVTTPLRRGSESDAPPSSGHGRAALSRPSSQSGTPTPLTGLTGGGLSADAPATCRRRYVLYRSPRIGALRAFQGLAEELIILGTALVAHLRKRTNAQRLVLSTCKNYLQKGALPLSYGPMLICA